MCPSTGQGGPRGSGLVYPLNAELNPICHLLALLGGATIIVVSRLRVKAPDYLDVRHYKGGRSSAIRTGCLYPRRNAWYSFSEVESTSGHMVLSEGTTEKIPSGTTGNRSRDRPTSSAAS